MKMHFRFLMFAVAALAIAAAPAGAKPTPEPGGANQARAVAGSLHAMLFNGQARIKKMALAKPDGSPAESYADDADTTWIVLRALMSNGTPRVLEMTQFSASIVDGDGVAVAAQPDKVRPAGMVTNIPPGGAWHETVLFAVPKGFKPVKIVLVSANPRYKSFRIAIAASDIPS
jgi:hypothetical protein